LTKSVTYRDAGVDIKRIRAAQNSIGDIISLTHKLLPTGRVMSGFGHYAGLIKLGSNIFALHSDGVGTKVILAQLMNRFDTVGIDCIAMNVNDIICLCAQPIGFIDYLALKQPNEWLIGQIAKGLVEGAKQAQVAIVGGETAVLPDVIAGESENAFDLAGMVMGVVKGKPVMGNHIKAGDIILGIASSGLHSNGYTLARKVLLSKYSVDDNAEYLIHTVGEELLIPTRIYVRPTMEILRRKIKVHGLAHITGGSFTKLPRLNANVRYVLESLPSPTGIFRQIQLDGRIDTKEMYRTFNMGIGFCIVAPKTSADYIIDIFEKYGMNCLPIGRIADGNGEVIARIDGQKEIL
jgi:phosphoribosylformylglycinamidine cyclo-ligase